MQRTVIVFGYKINRIFLRLILQLKAVASCDELVPNRNKFITLKKTTVYFNSRLWRRTWDSKKSESYKR